MQKLKSGILAILAIAVTATSCKHDSSVSPKSSSNTYQPTSKGSYWTYKTTMGSESSTSTATMTGSTQTINGKTYYVANRQPAQDGVNNAYYYVNNHVYSMMEADALGDNIETTYLNDNEDVGYSWTSSFSSTGDIEGTPAQLTGVIKEKGITKTVNGKSFNNVIHTHLELQYNDGEGFVTVSTYEYYIAKGIGIIETETNGFGFAETVILTDYKIN